MTMCVGCQEVPGVPPVDSRDRAIGERMTPTCKHGHYLSCDRCREEEEAFASKTPAPFFVAPPPPVVVSAREWRADRARARRAMR